MDDEAIDRLRAETRAYQTDPSFRARYDGLNPAAAELRAVQERVFVELLAPVHRTLAGLRLLDVGCGGGRWLRWYLELGAEAPRLAGVDVSDVHFERARAINPTVQLTQIDGVRLPFDDASFDLVTQWTCFMCIPTDAWRHVMAKEILRVLRPGGHVFWWDTPRANERLTDGLPMDPAAFFPGLPIVRRDAGAHGRPSDAIRNSVTRTLLGPFVNRLGGKPTHVAARIGPRP